MQSIFSVSLLATLAFSTTAVGGLAPSTMTKFNIECPAPKVLPLLDASYHECRHRMPTDKTCSAFVQDFKQLLPEYDCQRSFDATPTANYIVPAIWLAGDGALEDYVTLLSRLDSPEAKNLFASKEFRAILDGALAEEFLPLSRKAEKEIADKDNKRGH